MDLLVVSVTRTGRRPEIVVIFTLEIIVVYTLERLKAKLLLQYVKTFIGK